MIQQNSTFSGDFPDITQSLNKKELRLLNRKHALMRFEGGNGNLTLEFRAGMLVKVVYTSESLTKNEPDE